MKKFREKIGKNFPGKTEKKIGEKIVKLYMKNIEKISGKDWKNFLRKTEKKFE